jgi:glycosyltransferase involved in cell wall biosynthesis
MTTLSIIIPTLNEERHIDALLSDVAAQTRAPDEVIVVDAGSQDATVEVVARFPFAKVLEGRPPVACGRNLGGRSAGGDVLIFLDADARPPKTFLERFLAEFERRRLDVACPLYLPYRSTRAIEAFHVGFNLITRASQGVLPSGGGTCIAVRGGVFRQSSGFDPSLKFDDIELIRRLSRGRRFGIVEERLYLSDRRYREGGVARTMLQISLIGLFFVFGKYSWANHLDYEINGKHRY